MRLRRMMRYEVQLDCCLTRHSRKSEIRISKSERRKGAKMRAKRTVVGKKGSKESCDQRVFKLPTCASGRESGRVTDAFRSHQPPPAMSTLLPPHDFLGPRPRVDNVEMAAATVRADESLPIALVTRQFRPMRSPGFRLYSENGRLAAPTNLPCDGNTMPSCGDWRQNWHTTSVDDPPLASIRHRSIRSSVPSSRRQRRFSRSAVNDSSPA